MLCFGALSIFFLLKSVLVTASVTQSQPRDATVDGSSWDYDVIVVGGGPAGLSALSGLARVHRKAFLIDSGEYRNSETRHLHDLIGLDGLKPAYFRWLAREKLAFYNTVGMTNGTVTNITAHNTTGFPTFTVEATLPSGPTRLTARSVILATGIRDILPDTPGIAESWARGIYWCPWCDGNEHANQSMGLLSDLSGVAQAYFEMNTLNSDVMAFVNGTDTPKNREIAGEKFGAGWERYLQDKNVTIYNETILSITRLRDGYNPDQDPSIPTAPEYDLFRIDLEGGISLERAVFFADFDSELRSDLGQKLGVGLVGKPAHLFVDAQSGMQTNIPMVFAVGDANNDNSTNLPHAMWSGKRSAVELQVKLSVQDMEIELAATGAEPSTVSTRGKELDPRDVWDAINGPLGDLFYAGEFYL